MKAMVLSALTVIALSPVAPVAFAADECDPGEPDTHQVSWTAPCDDGTWLLDTQGGCRNWDWHPAPEDTVTWSGACQAGSKEGKGTLQWVEHGRPIDRFEGAYRRNERTGFGRYRWNELDAYEGNYVAGLPQGTGTACISGKPYTGLWHRGCLLADDKVIAIGTSIGACGAAVPDEAVAAAPVQR